MSRQPHHSRVTRLHVFVEYGLGLMNYVESVKMAVAIEGRSIV